MTLPEKWETVAFAEITPPTAPIIYGILQPGPDRTDGIPYVRPTEIQDDVIDLTSIRRTSPEIAEQYRRSTLEQGDTILTIVGTIGKVAAVPPELRGGNITQSSCRIRADRDIIEPAFLRHFLRSPAARAQYDRKRLGTAVPRLNIADIRNFQTPVPPLAEQRRIVAKLHALTTRLARARAELDRVPVLAKRLRETALDAAFGAQPADTMTVGALVTDVRYGTAKKCDYASGSTPVLRIPNVQSGRINLADMKSADFDEKERAKLALREGDVLVIRSNGSLDLVGRSAVVSETAVGMLYAGYLIRLRPDLQAVRPAYLHRFLSSPAARTAIESAARSTSGVNNVNAQQLQALRMPVCSLPEQDAMTADLDAVLARADRLEAEAARARALLDRLEAGILARAFRGELVPQDLKDEPASVLLARIRAQRAAAPKTKRGRKAKEAAA